MVRTAIISLLALVLALGVALSAARPALAGAGPYVITGSKAGPIDIPSAKVSTGKTIAALSLPEGGWFVTAKAVLVGAGPVGSNHGPGCALIVGSVARADEVFATPAGDGRDGSRVPILLTTAGRLSSPGKAKLRCVLEVDSPGQTRIRDIRITALRAGTLTTWEGVTVAKTTGTGSPQVISLRMSSSESVTIAGDGADHHVGRLDLPAGRWWVVAKAVAVNSGGVSDDVSCRLDVGGDFDDQRFHLSLPSAGTLMPLALQAVHAFDSPGSVVLHCRGSIGFTIVVVTITAVEPGRLTNVPLGGGPTWSKGAGLPRVISGWSNGPIPVAPGSTWTTVATLNLRAGRWTILGKLFFEAESVPPSAERRRLICRLAWAGAQDRSEVVYADNVTRVAPLVLSVAGQSSSAGSAVLQCRRTTAGGTGAVWLVKMTALKAGSLVELGG